MDKVVKHKKAFGKTMTIVETFKESICHAQKGKNQSIIFLEEKVVKEDMEEITSCTSG